MNKIQWLFEKGKDTTCHLVAMLVCRSFYLDYYSYPNVPSCLPNSLEKRIRVVFPQYSFLWSLVQNNIWIMFLKFDISIIFSLVDFYSKNVRISCYLKGALNWKIFYLHHKFPQRENKLLTLQCIFRLVAHILSQGMHKTNWSKMLLVSIWFLLLEKKVPHSKSRQVVQHLSRI